MATLTSTKIKNTYDALLKATDNDAIGSSAKQITDGLGNGTPLYISTTQIGIGVTPEATYDLHVYSNAKVGGNLTVTGDLTVEGTTTTIDTQTLTVEDPLIEVASNNTSTDAVDIGFYGKYAPSGTTLYAGLFRDTGDSKFKLFRNLQEQPTTTVNTSGTGYTVATLVADLEGTLTGTIASSTVATTQSTGDNSTKVATTAYVDASIGNSTLAEVLVNGNTTSGTDISVSASDDITFTNTSKAIFGGSLDLQVYSDGSNNYIDSTSNELRIRSNDLRLLNYGTAKYITADNGADVSLYYNNSKKLETTTTGVTVTGAVSATTFSGQLDGTISSTTTATTQTQGDNSTKVATTAYVDSAIGGQDTLAEILANGNTTGGTDIEISTGDQVIFNNNTELRWKDSGGSQRTILELTNTNDLYFGGSFSGSLIFVGGGSYTERFRINDDGNLALPDNGKLLFGAGSDLQIYHNGTDSVIKNQTGDLYIENTADDKDIIFMSDNGSGGTEVYFELQGVSGGANPFTVFPDNSYLVFGSGHDLQISHDGSNSYINDTGTGLLKILTNGLEIKNPADNGYMAFFGATGAAELYFNTAKKFETTSTGVSVTGDVVSSAIVQAKGFRTETGSTDYSLLTRNSSNTAVYIQQAGTGNILDVRYGSQAAGQGTSAMSVSSSGNTTFTGNIDINGNNKHIRFVDTYGNWLIEAGDGANNFKIHSQSLAADYLTLEGGGQLNLGEYGSGSFTGTATYRLAVDSSGDVIEIPIGGGAVDGSGTANYVTKWSDTDTITNSIIYDNGTNVGIGTITPDHKLRVNGDARLGNLHIKTSDFGTGGTGKTIYADGAGTGVLGFISTTAFDFSNGSTSRVRIDSSGRVGIGTTSPAAKFEVTDGSSSITLQEYSNGAAIFLDGVNGDFIGGDYFHILADGNSYLGLGGYGGGTTPLNITNAGNVGIGTTSPLTAFEVIGTDPNNNVSRVVNIKDDRSYAANVGGGISFFGKYNSTNGYSTYGQIIGGKTNATDGDYSGYLSFKTRPNNALPIERMRIDSNGKAIFKGDVDIEGGLLTVGQGNNGENRIEIGKDRTTNGFAYIDLVGDTTYTDYGFRIIRGSQGANAETILTHRGTGVFKFDADDVADMIFSTNSTERMRIDSSGDLTMQGGRIYVKESDLGNTAIALTRDADEGYVQLFSSGTQTVQIRGNGDSYINGGQVGIGTSSPSQKLDVSGAIAINGTETISSNRQNLYLNSFAGDGGSGIFFRDGFTYNCSITAEDHNGAAADGICISGYDGISFSTGSNSKNEVVRITGGSSNIGRVGIGTTTPSYKLHVVNSGASAMWIAENDSASSPSTNAPALTIQNTNTNDNVWTGINFADAGGQVASAIYSAFTNQANNYGIQSFYTRGSDGYNERLRISETGNVSIGATGARNSRLLLSNAGSSGAPQLMLVDSGDSSKLSEIRFDSGTLYFDYWSGSSRSERMRITSGGDLQTYGSNRLNLRDDGSYIYEDGGLIIGNGGTGTGRPIKFLTENTERMRIDSSGNVLINSGVYLSWGTNVASSIEGSTVSNKLQFRTNSTDAMIIDSSQNVGIGTSSPSAKLDVNGEGRFVSNGSSRVLYLKQNANDAGNIIQFENQNGTNIWELVGRNNQFYIYNNALNTFAMYISPSNNNIGIGTSSPSYKLDVNGEIRASDDINTTNAKVFASKNNDVAGIFNRNTSTGNVVLWRYANTQVGSVVVNVSSTIYLTSSDYRLKENVVEMTGALDRVNQLQPKRFNFIADAKTTVDGFLAHEVQDIVPESIYGIKDEIDEEGNPVYQGIDQSKLVPLLVGAIKELKAEIETLKAQINN